MSLYNNGNWSENIRYNHDGKAMYFEGHLISRKFDTDKANKNLPKYWMYSIVNVIFAVVLGFDIFRFPLNVYLLVIVISSFFTAIAVLWYKHGYERIIMNDDHMVVQNRLFFMGWKKKYCYKKIKEPLINNKFNEKVISVLDVINIKKLSGSNTGYLTFTYGTNRCEFGNIFTPEEAYSFLDVLKHELVVYRKNSKYD